MNKPVLSAVLAICFVAGIAGSELRAQGPAPSQVAILDLTYVFKNHQRFKSLTGEMDNDVKAAETEVNNEREAVKALIKRLEDYRPGTQEYKGLEEEIANRQADLQVKMNLHKKNFLERESKIYYDVYREVMDHVRYYCESSGVTLVLRFNGDEISPDDPQQVLKELNKNVLYYHRAIDITPIVLQRLNTAVPAVSGPPRTGVLPR